MNESTALKEWRPILFNLLTIEQQAIFLRDPHVSEACVGSGQ